MWKLERVPEEIRPTVKELFQAGEYGRIRDIYAKYEVFPAGTCETCGVELQVKEWTKYAIQVVWK